MFCYKCGQQLPDDAKFCSRCGIACPDADTPAQVPAGEPELTAQEPAAENAVNTDTPAEAAETTEAPAEAAPAEENALVPAADTSIEGAAVPEKAAEAPTDTASDSVPQAEAAETKPAETAEKAEKSGRRGFIITIIALSAVIVAMAVLFLFFADRDKLSFASCVPNSYGEELVGVWESGEDSLVFSTNGKAVLNGASFDYKCSADTITLTGDGSKDKLGYTLGEDTLVLTLNDKDITFTPAEPSDPDELIGEWLGDAGEIVFNEDGTAVVAGVEYSYVATGYEIIFTPEKSGQKDYLIYSIENGKLEMYRPSAPGAVLSFNKASFAAITGTWTDDYGSCMVVYPDGTVYMEDMELMNDVLGVDISMYFTETELVMDMYGISMGMKYEIDGIEMRLSFDMDDYSDSTVMYRLSERTDLTEDEFDELWEELAEKYDWGSRYDDWDFDYDWDYDWDYDYDYDFGWGSDSDWYFEYDESATDLFSIL